MSQDDTAVEAKRLTKKEQKALKHRSGQGSKGAAAKRKAAIAAAIPDTPELDLLDDDEAAPVDAPPSKKRKLDEDEAASPKKRKKTEWDEPDAGAKPKAKQRLICFVGELALCTLLPRRTELAAGNLPYNVEASKIASHFADQCGALRTICFCACAHSLHRGDAQCPPANAKDALRRQEAIERLRFRRIRRAGRDATGAQAAPLDPRRAQDQRCVCWYARCDRVFTLNAAVELTAGGGGTGDARKTKLAKNKARLDAQRVKKAPADTAASTAAKKDDGTPALSKNAKRRGKAGDGAAGQAAKKPPRPKKEPKPAKPQLSGANMTRLG
jgi:nucleolar protein 6